MNRRAILGGIGVATGGLLLSTGSQAKTTFSSNGYGLRIDEFKAVQGPGVDGQSYVQYEYPDGTMFVGQDNATTTVNFIERYWTPEGRATRDIATAAAQNLLPTDSELNETYYAQFGAIGYGTLIERYRSGTLKFQYGEAATSNNAIFTVVYEYVPSTTSMDMMVLRFSILAANLPEA